MIDQKNILTSSFKDRIETGDDKSGNWTRAKTTDNNYRYFAVERGNKFVRRFKLLLRDGRTISVPYAHLPVFIYTPEEDLKIRTGDIEISIKGRSLHKLEAWLSEEKITWIKESASGADPEDSAVFVEHIRVDGDLLI